MRLLFRGWRRELTTHVHPVTAVEHRNGKFSPKGEGEPLIWDDSLSAYGKVDGLALSGSFLIEFEFDEGELGNWLIKYSKKRPEAALRLIALAQAEATISLSKAHASEE